MRTYVETLKRVGVVLVSVGVVDLAYMVYCIVTEQGYSSSLNIFAVIAGVYLWRGHLGAVRLVTRFGAFFLAAAIGTLVFLVPFLQPMDLWVTQLKLNPIGSILGFLMTLALFGVLAWTYGQLRSAPVLQALQNDGRTTAAPRLAMGIGIVLPLAMGVVFHFTLSGEAGAKAVDLAKAEYGDQYKYSPTAINWAGNRVSARLTAYNDHEIKVVTVEWQK